jgi:outer membrane protein assembly factor BamB
VKVAFAVAAVVATAVAGIAYADPSSTRAGGTDWNRFNYDAARSGSAPGSGITAQNVTRLRRLKVALDGTVDSAPIYLHDVRVRGGTHDTFFVTTTYGRTEAIDADSGHVLWRFTPPAYSRLAGSAQITNATPAASGDRSAIYAAAPDGRIRKLRVRDGKVLWTTTITRDPTHEKITSSLNVTRGLVVAATGGYIGDAPPYQGHVVTMSERAGRIAHVWNSLCSNRKGLILPRTCPSSDSAIWSRSGAAVDPVDGTLVVATGNAPWNGRTDWGDSVLVLAPDASRLLRHYTPPNYQQLNDSDADLGSTSPALLPNGYALQGGKDGLLRLLQLRRLPGVNTRTGGEVQTLPAPGSTDVFSAPAVWRGTWVFVTTSAGTEALRFENRRLHMAWSNGTGGTSPVVAGSLLYVAGDGALHVYAPTSGREVATIPTGPAHWQSPIVADGRVAIAEGNANDHATHGVLDIFRLP